MKVFINEEENFKVYSLRNWQPVKGSENWGYVFMFTTV